ncbi:hypothetical protein D0Z07_5513 [Hyphodiscus hymeniophilus]|uniref:Ilp is an apoptosis inhibitor n=1 Tax=Hyphodiscus hymeniophilus TaxID=353542 RepID=A0A9P6VIB7_9HELO|nr:hypothetical protein D0Z07_5513 [Hyphodiscus hymeniophilus]
MAFNPHPGPSAHSFNFQPQASFDSYGKTPQRQTQSLQANPPFDIIEWYPQFQSCHRYFLDHAQHSAPVQALSAFMNIQLPYQKQPFPVLNSASTSPRSGATEMHLRPNPFGNSASAAHAQSVSLTPYIRRLIATGHDTPAILHGFFGDDWVKGIGQLHEIERRNYLFAAKSTSWLKVKQAYDLSADETIPFLSPLRDASEAEIEKAEATWSEWLAMQDWMLGPRAPDNMKRGPRVKREPQE